MKEETPQIYSKIAQIMKEIGAIGKDRKNEQQGYKFRGIEDLYNAAHPLFAEHGVFCCPTVLEYETTDRVRKSGSIAIRVIMRICHRFYAPDASFVEVTTIGEAIDDADKASNKCMSAAMKYALIELLCVPTQDLEDADRVTPEAGAKIAEAAKGSETRTFGTKKPKDTELEEFNAKFTPTDPPAEFISHPQQINFARRFRESLPKPMQHKAEKLKDVWLRENKYLDKDGLPTSTMIPANTFEDVKLKACIWAGEQKEGAA